MHGLHKLFQVVTERGSEADLLADGEVGSVEAVVEGKRIGAIGDVGEERGVVRLGGGNVAVSDSGSACAVGALPWRAADADRCVCRVAPVSACSMEAMIFEGDGSSEADSSQSRRVRCTLGHSHPLPLLALGVAWPLTITNATPIPSAEQVGFR